jgi:hypothetical protein
MVYLIESPHSHDIPAVMACLSKWNSGAKQVWIRIHRMGLLIDFGRVLDPGKYGDLAKHLGRPVLAMSSEEYVGHWDLLCVGK